MSILIRLISNMIGDTLELCLKDHFNMQHDISQEVAEGPIDM